MAAERPLAESERHGVRILFLLLMATHRHHTPPPTVCDWYENYHVKVCGPDNGYGHVNVTNVYTY